MLCVLCFMCVCVLYTDREKKEEEGKNGIRKIIITIFMSRPSAVILHIYVCKLYLAFDTHIHNTNHKSLRNKSYIHIKCV